LGYDEKPSRSPEQIQDLANISNAQKYSAKMAGDDSSNLYFMQFIRSLKSKVMKAGVMGIYDYNLEVVLIETGHSVKVFYKVKLCYIHASFIDYGIII
jgi:DIS3-like exonuclease 2